MSPELQQLAKQLKQNIRTLIATGNKEEAKELLAGMKEITPEDEEIEEFYKMLA